jgi:flagellar biogenesis protein FliO
MTSVPNASAASAAASSTAIPFKPVASFEPGVLGDGWFLAGLGLLMALAIGVLIRQRKPAWLPRPGNGGRTIAIVESTRLGDRMRLSVVRFHDRELLVAHGEHSATVLADSPLMARPEETAE